MNYSIAAESPVTEGGACDNDRTQVDAIVVDAGQTGSGDQHRH